MGTGLFLLFYQRVLKSSAHALKLQMYTQRSIQNLVNRKKCLKFTQHRKNLLQYGCHVPKSVA